ncbi:MAG: group II intron maturase-specific domain-containing protein, partial [Candidatus Entotheonellia bacterium]
MCWGAGATRRLIGTTRSSACAMQAGATWLGSHMTLTSSALVVFGSRRAMTASSLPLRWDVVRLHHPERCAQKPGPIAGSKLFTWDARRELYDIFCNIVGSIRSPLLANLRLDEFDKELETRGHRFARDADEANIDVRSRQAGARVRARVTRVRERKLRLTVNEAKSAVDRPWNRTCLGCTCTTRRPNRRKVSDRALKACNAKVRAITSRTRGRTIGQIVQELRQLRLGWRACFGVAEVRSPLRDLDTRIRRRLRSDPWKPWGRKSYRQLRTRGVGRQLAWNTVKSAHGPWRLRQSPALAI